MKPKDEKGANRQEPGEPWQPWRRLRTEADAEADELKKDLFFISLLCLGIMGVVFAYAWLVTPNFRFDLGSWLVLLIASFMSACVVYLTIQAIWSWVRKTGGKLTRGETTIWDVIWTAIICIIVVWFFGSA